MNGNMAFPHLHFVKGSLEGTSVLRQLIESQLLLRQMKRRNKRARKYVRACGGSIESCKKHGPVRELVSPENRKLACSRRLVGPLSKRVRSAFGARAHWHGNAKVSPGLNCVAGAALSQGQVQISGQAQHFRKIKFSQGLNCVAGAARSKGQVQISWQAQHFRKVKCRFRGRRSTFARSCTDFVAGAALSQGQAQISWQAQHFHKVMYRFRGRCSTFGRSSAKFVAGASLSQGQVQISWQAQRFRKVKYRFRGRRSTFARTTFAAGARTSQLLSTKVVREVNFRSWGLNIATFKYESSTRSPLSQPGLENRNF